MTPLHQRQTIVSLVHQACVDGARTDKACQQIGLSMRTLQRWKQDRASNGDRRTSALRCGPERTHNQLTPEQRTDVLEVANSAEFAALPPSQIVPLLADRGRYIASESTFYRILRQEKQLAHRRKQRQGVPRTKPRSLCAQAINCVYSWDITYLPSSIKGQYYYLYAFVDLFSRKIVGWQVFNCESTEHARDLLESICQREGIQAKQLTVHSDNGGPMKGQTRLALMDALGVSYTRSRPSVSNDNPYSEALFKTLKYRVDLPIEPFADLVKARDFIAQLVQWYNEEHQHSSIGFVTPSQRHAGLDHAILQARDAVYKKAKEKHPERWSGSTRNWAYVDSVYLNPEHPQNEENSQPINS
jgi:transposase InsO family protein